MPASLSTGPDPVTNTRAWLQPLLLVLTGAAATYAVLTAHSHLAQRQRKARPALRRRNAIRRTAQDQQQAQVRGSGRSHASQQVSPEVALAVQALERFEHDDGSYGHWQGWVLGEGPVSGNVAPRSIVDVEQHLVRNVRSRDVVEDVLYSLQMLFVDLFMCLELPPSRSQINPAEQDYIANEFARQGFDRSEVATRLQPFVERPNYRNVASRQRHAWPVSGGYVTTWTAFRRHREREVTERRDDVRTAPPPLAQARALSELLPPDLSDPDAPLHATIETISSAVAQTSALQQREAPYGALHDGNLSELSFGEEPAQNDAGNEGQHLLNLLYHIADDEARRDGYIHRGVTCNSCNATPITGVRYRCANCLDFDLCETCEAMQIHNKTHLFYKIRIPAPFVGSARQTQPVIYPGKPDSLPASLSRTLVRRLLAETGLTKSELEALWEQFRCLANAEWLDDPNKLGLAIDRRTFDRCFAPTPSTGPPVPSLIYDRMFAYYDINDDGLIGFEEFIKGLAALSNRNRHDRLLRAFNAYDLDRDGYIERKDILRVLRAYYVLTRELTRETVTHPEDEFFGSTPRDIILGAAPVSSAFPVNLDPYDSGNRHVHSRAGEGKRVSAFGDLSVVDGEGIFKPDADLTRDREQTIGNTAVRRVYNTARPMRRLRRLLHGRHRRLAGDDLPSDGDDDSQDSDVASTTSADQDSDYKNIELFPSFFEFQPPKWQIEEADIVEALGAYVPIEEISDPVDCARVGYVTMRRLDLRDELGMEEIHRQRVLERWERRQFYTDEEDGSRPPIGWHEEGDEGDSDGAESVRLPPSPRSRSSSKVRFQDDVTDNEYDTYDTRSNASTRSIPVAERWGGFEIPEAEKDVGKEVLYQVVQEGINELLDLLFKSAEDTVIMISRTRRSRERLAEEIDRYIDSLPDSHPLKTDGRTVQDETSATPASDDRIDNAEDRREADDEAANGVAGAVSDVRRESDPDARGLQALSSTSLALDPTLPQHRPNASPAQMLGADPHTIAQDALQLHMADQEAETRAAPSVTQSPTGLAFSSQETSPVEQVLSPSDSIDTASELPAMASFELYPSRGVSHADPDGSSLASQTQAGEQALDQPTPANVVPVAAEHRQGSWKSIAAMATAAAPVPDASTKAPAADGASQYSADLEFLARMNQAEREAERRGGLTAKLTFDEFVLKIERERRLEFLLTWIDVTSF
ncbi:hypothetical protein KEM52_002571 [Ascosphaera acerosa]|nr:hypothetical protein KEM52_002571 [Ascosphaera acerosa]